jgi:hypothetical protein
MEERERQEVGGRWENHLLIKGPPKSNRYVQIRTGPVLPLAPPVVPVCAERHGHGTRAVLPVEHPVVPVFRRKPELPLHHRSTTASHPEVLQTRAVVGAVVGPEHPLEQQFLCGGDPGGTTAQTTGSTGLPRPTGTSGPPPVYHRAQYRRVSPLCGTWGGSSTGTTGHRYYRSGDRYYRHVQDCSFTDDFWGPLSPRTKAMVGAK